VNAMEESRLWTWAHRELGDSACEEIQDACDSRSPDKSCICGDVLRTMQCYGIGVAAAIALVKRTPKWSRSVSEWTRS
jgi:hypothetical protein